MIDHDDSRALQERVRAACASGTPLAIHGGNSKRFLGHAVDGEPLDISRHSGIISYEPTELVITARAGTPLSDIEAKLAKHNQLLPFEPPAFGENATLGGTIACNLSGPRRPYAGAARDYVLGCTLLNGKGEILRFGGEVMKNVAGYDVSRLMAGAFGTLGVLLDVSLKVLPRPAYKVMVMLQDDVPQSIQVLESIARKPLPMTAACFDGERLYLRLCGSDRLAEQVSRDIGGEVLAQDATLWADIKEQRHPFFDGADNLWRVSVPFNVPPLAINGDWFYDWGGAQRWLKTTASAEEVRTQVAASGGHATLFRSNETQALRFQPLSSGLLRIHRNLKQAFDPGGILNPGRMYPGL